MGMILQVPVAGTSLHELMLAFPAKGIAASIKYRGKPGPREAGSPGSFFLGGRFFLRRRFLLFLPFLFLQLL